MTASTAVVGSTVQFTASAAGGVPPYSYDWAFGDGGTGSSASPQHVFASAGTFSVSVAVKDAIGTQATGSLELDVTPPPTLVSGQTLKILSPGPPAIAAAWWGGTAEMSFYGTNGEVDITPTVDGNELTLGGTHAGQAYSLGFFPGDAAAGGLSAAIPWGAVLTLWLIDTSIFDVWKYGIANTTAGPGGEVAWLEANFPGAYLGSVQVTIPKPVLTVKDLGLVAGTADTHDIAVQYEDSLGNPLQAVANPGGVIPISGGQTSIVVAVPASGTVTVQVAGPLAFEVAFGGVYSGGAPYSANTVVSNELTI